MTTTPLIETWNQIFDGKYRIDGDCLIWTKYLNNRGYGAETRQGRTYLAHRESWRLANQVEIPAGMQVDHFTCFNHACINPNHLKLKTPSGNNFNRKGANPNNRTSGFRNVYPQKGSSTWYYRIRLRGVAYMGSGFATAEEANQAATTHRERLSR